MEISTFGLARSKRTRLLPFCSVSNGPHILLDTKNFLPQSGLVRSITHTTGSYPSYTRKIFESDSIFEILILFWSHDSALQILYQLYSTLPVVLDWIYGAKMHYVFLKLFPSRLQTNTVLVKRWFGSGQMTESGIQTGPLTSTEYRPTIID